MFPDPLVVSVWDAFANFLPGVSVTYTAHPVFGGLASGIFSNGTATITAVTDWNGNTSVPFWANNVVGGTHTVSATAPGLAYSANFSFYNNP